jgi:sugar lactone lactonase YvrE
MIMIIQLAVVIVVVSGVILFINRSLPGFSSPQQGMTVIRPPYDTWAIVEQGERVWAGGRDGLFALDKKSGDLLRLDMNENISLRYVSDLVLDEQGGLWVGHQDGLIRYSNGEWTTLTEDDGLLSGPVAALLVDRDGVLWVGGESSVARYDGTLWESFTAEDGLAHPSVNVIFLYKAGTLWFGSSSLTNGGLTSYDGTSWTAYSSSNGLAHSSVNDIIQDRNGALWVATGYGDVGGLSRLENDR